MSSASSTRGPSTGRSGAQAPLTTESRMVGKQVVFRVRNPQTQARRAPRRPKTMTTDGATEEPVRQSRRTHRKSRMGCNNCKERRIKCDETRPGCQKCDAYGISCDYTSDKSQSPPANPSQVARRDVTSQDSIDITLSSMAAADLVTTVNNALKMGGVPERGYGSAPLSSSSDAIVSLRSYIDLVGKWSYMPDGHRRIMSTEVVQLAFSTPYLMHAVLGAALCAMGRVDCNVQRWKMTEAHHWQQAIKQYQRVLAQPIGSHNMDQLLSTCILLSMMSFSEVEYDPRDSWVFSTDPRALNWFLVQGGLKWLICATIPWLKDSMWMPVFRAGEPNGKSFDDHEPGRDRLHPALADLCEIHESTTEDDNPYHWPLRLLSWIFSLPMNRHNFTQLCAFMGRMEPSYLSLLMKKDERAVLLFGYWLAKVCEDPSCHAYPRFQSECFAICMFLEHSVDPRIVELLQYPAEMCGYSLSHTPEADVFAADDLQLEQLFREL